MFLSMKFSDFLVNHVARNESLRMDVHLCAIVWGDYKEIFPKLALYCFVNTILRGILIYQWGPVYDHTGPPSYTVHKNEVKID